MENYETLDHIMIWINSCLISIENDVDNNMIDNTTVESAAKLLSYIKKIVNEEYVDDSREN